MTRPWPRLGGWSHSTGHTWGAGHTSMGHGWGTGHTAQATPGALVTPPRAMPGGLVTPGGHGNAATPWKKLHSLWPITIRGEPALRAVPTSLRPREGKWLAGDTRQETAKSQRVTLGPRPSPHPSHTPGPRGTRLRAAAGAGVCAGPACPPGGAGVRRAGPRPGGSPHAAPTPSSRQPRAGTSFGSFSWARKPRPRR